MQEYVVLDFARGTGDAFNTYQQFAVMCAERKVHRALVKSGLEDADIHYTLHDVLSMVALVLDGPIGIRLALVERSASVAKVYRSMQPQLRTLGCDVRIFDSESEAADWLGCAGSCPLATPAKEAAPA